jgi:thermitase
MDLSHHPRPAKYEFTLRGRTVTVAPINGVTAIRPARELRVAGGAEALVRRFGARAADDTTGGSVGLVLPARNRGLFEGAGWLFVEASRDVAAAAVTRAPVQGAESVRRVYLGRGGILIGTDRVTVRAEPGMPEDELVATLRRDGMVVVRRLAFAADTYEARIIHGRDELELVAELQAAPRPYRFVEPVFIEAITGRRTPTDPEYREQWQHRNSGANGGRAGADIGSEAAWSKTRGAGVRIAVVDNGFDVTHPDLAPALARGGYFVSDAMGSTTFRPWRRGDPGFPDGDHGTFCLGMAGARMDNGVGGCGSAPEADLVPVACLTDQVGTQVTLARAIAYAADPTTEDPAACAADGAHVIACSLGPNGADWTMSSVLDLAIEAAAVNGRGGLGIPIFWAATNGPFDIAHDEVCSHPRVLAVSRSNRYDLEDGAAFGAKLEFVAPGVDVLSTSSGGDTSFSTGCSFAAPLAAGVAALVLAQNPGMTRDQVVQRLRDSCDKIGGVVYDAQGRHDHYGYGRINAAKAV